MRWAASYESKSDIIFRPRSVQVEIGDETTLTLRTKKERKKLSGQNALDRWVLAPTAPPNLRPREGVPEGQRAWGGPSPLCSLTCVIVQGARRADAPGSRQVDLWGHEAGDQAPGADPELAAASLASPPVLQPNQEGIKHIKDPLKIFIGSVSGALNQILFFKSIWADGLKQGLDQRSEAQGSHGLCAEPSLSVPYRSNLRSGWKHRACLKPLQKCVLRNRPKNSFPGKS